MGLLKQDHNVIKSDLRAAVVPYPKRLPQNGQFKPVCGRGARARVRACSIGNPYACVAARARRETAA